MFSTSESGMASGRIRDRENIYFFFCVLANLFILYLWIGALTEDINPLESLYSLTTFGKVGCRAVAVIIHFTTLATFFWTNIMAWDIYKTFGQRTVLSHIRQKGGIKSHFTIISWIPLCIPGLYFPRYAAYGFGIPTTIVLFALSIDTSGFIPSLTVGYGKVETGY